MPRWLVAIGLIGIGLIALYQGIANPRIRLRGSKIPLQAWQGRIFFGVMATMGIAGGLLAWIGPF